MPGVINFQVIDDEEEEAAGEDDDVVLSNQFEMPPQTFEILPQSSFGNPDSSSNYIYYTYDSSANQLANITWT